MVIVSGGGVLDNHQRSALVEALVGAFQTVQELVRAVHSGTDINLAYHIGLDGGTYRAAYDAVVYVEAKGLLERFVRAALMGARSNVPLRDAAAAINVHIADPSKLPRVPGPSADRLFGRDQQFASLAGRLAQAADRSRFALYGLPGVGKTELALHAANHPAVREAFPGGVLWAPVGRKPQRDRTLQRWAQALGLSVPTTQGAPVEERNKTLRDTIRDALGAKRILIVIDDVWNLEHAQDNALEDSVHLITTLHPSVADHFVSSPQHVEKVDELPREGALDMLRFYVGDAVEACRDKVELLAVKLGNRPLALRLVGKELQHSARVADNYGFFGRKLDAVLKRGIEHPELDAADAAIDACIELLDPAEQGKLFRLSVFPPSPVSFPADAAAKVCGGEMWCTDGLLSAGLLEVLRSVRYALHQAVADRADRRLRADGEAEAEAVRDFAEHYADFAERKRNDHDALAVELVNIGAAGRRAIEHGDLGHLLVRGANACSDYLLARGMYETAKEFLEPALEAAARLGPEAARETAWKLAIHLEKLGEYRRAESVLTRHAGPPPEPPEPEPEPPEPPEPPLPPMPPPLGAGGHGAIVTAQICYLLSVLAYNFGDHDGSDALIGRGLAALDSLRPDPPAGLPSASAAGAALQEWGTRCDLLERRCLNGIVKGEWERALRSGLAGLALARRLGDVARRATHLRNLSWYFQSRGAIARSCGLARLGLERARKLGHHELEAAFHHLLGKAALLARDFGAAERDIGSALDNARRIGHRWYEAVSWLELGRIRLGQTRLPEAREAFEAALRIAEKIDSAGLRTEAAREVAALVMTTPPVRPSALRPAPAPDPGMAGPFH